MSAPESGVFDTTVLGELKCRQGSPDNHSHVLDGAKFCERDLLRPDGKERGIPNNVYIAARYGTRIYLHHHGAQPWPVTWNEDMGLSKIAAKFLR